MSVKAALIDHIKWKVTDLGNRVRPNVALTSDTLPYCVVQQISGVPTTTLAGDTGFTDRRFQVDIYADDALEVQTIADEVRNKLSGLTGTLGTTNTATVRLVQMESEGDGYIPPDAATEFGKYRRTLDLTIHNLETAPALD